MARHPGTGPVIFYSGSKFPKMKMITFVVAQLDLESPLLKTSTSIYR